MNDFLSNYSQSTVNLKNKSLDKSMNLGKKISIQAGGLKFLTTYVHECDKTSSFSSLT